MQGGAGSSMLLNVGARGRLQGRMHGFLLHRSG